MTDTNERMPRFQLHWESRNRGWYCENSSDFDRLTEKMKTLRRPADLYVMLEDGSRGERIGGVEPTDGSQDDQRIKWNWWFDNTYSQKEVQHAS